MWVFLEKGKRLLSGPLRRRNPLDLITEAFHKALKVDRSTLLHPTSKSRNEDSNILVTTFNPGSDSLKKVVTNNWDTLGRSCSTRQIYQNKVLQKMAYRRPKNLKDLLVRAKLSKMKPHETSATPCNPCSTKNCRYCPRLNKTGRITCSTSGRSYITKHNVTCKSELCRVIYALGVISMVCKKS